MSAVEVELWAHFHKKREREHGVWRIEHMLATLTSVVWNANFKKPTKPSDWSIQKVKPESNRNFPTPTELSAWAKRVNEKNGKRR